MFRAFGGLHGFTEGFVRFPLALAPSTTLHWKPPPTDFGVLCVRQVHPRGPRFYTVCTWALKPLYSNPFKAPSIHHIGTRTLRGSPQCSGFVGEVGL